MWKVFKVNEKNTSKTRVDCCSKLARFEQTLHLIWVFLWPFFEKQINVRCGIDSILMSLTSHIHDADNHAIGKNSCQSCFKKFEVLYFRKQQGAIRTDWKILSCIFKWLPHFRYFQQHNLFWYNTENSNFIFTYANWNINIIIGFCNHI